MGGHFTAVTALNLGLQAAFLGTKTIRTMRDIARKWVDFWKQCVLYSKKYEDCHLGRFFDLLIEQGSRFAWYFHLTPVGMKTAPELMPTREQREYLYMLRPCPMLENPEILQRMVHETGAHSTDVEEAEPVGHLCQKCEAYSQE